MGKTGKDNPWTVPWFPKADTRNYPKGYNMAVREIGQQPKAIEIFRLANRLFSNKMIRLQPLPNKKQTVVYQLHVRKKRPKDHTELKWDLVYEGNLVQMRDYLMNYEKG